MVMAMLTLLVGAGIGYAVAGVRHSLARQRGWDHLASVAQSRPVGADDVVAAFGATLATRNGRVR